MSLKNFIIRNDTKLCWRYREKYLASKNILNKLYYYIKIKRIEQRNNAELGISFHDPSAVFKGVPYFPHGLNGIIISRKAQIGEGAIILHQVTIGTAMISQKVREDLKAPIIGNNVYIGAGAKIIGDITIGNNVIIGANAVVIKDIPANCMAVGIPAKIKEINEKYLL